MGGDAMKPACNVATLIGRFFTERLMRQRNVSGNTIASYRDTFRLLFMFAQVRLRKSIGPDARRSGCTVHRRVPHRSRGKARRQREDA